MKQSRFRPSQTHWLMIFSLVLILGYGARYYYKYVDYKHQVSRYHVFINDFDAEAVNNGNQKLIEVIGKEAPYEMVIEVEPETMEKNTADTELESFLKSTEWMNSEDDRIKAKGLQIAAEASNSYERAKKIIEWTSREIAFNPIRETQLTLNRVSAVEATTTLADGSGAIVDRVMLSTTLLRSQGIPARIAYGHKFNDKTNIYYAWNEIYLEEMGWVSVDPNTGDMGIDSRYIRFFSTADLSELENWGESLKIGVERVNW